MLYIAITILFWTSKGDAAPSALCHREQLVGIERGSVRPFISNKGFAEFKVKEGFIVDLLGELAHELCPDKEIKDVFKVRQTDFDELFKRLAVERYDLVAGPISINAPNRERDQVAYSYPFYKEAGVVIALRETKHHIRNEEDLWHRIKNKTVVVQNETAGHQVAQLLNEKGLNLNIVPVENESELFSIDGSFAIIHDNPILQFHLHSNPKTKDPWEIVKAKGGSPLFLQRAQYGFVVSKYNLELLNELNRALTRLENDGALDLLKQCWIDQNRNACGRGYTVQAIDVKGTVESISKSDVKTGKVDILGTKGRTKIVNIDIDGELVSGQCNLWFSPKQSRLFERLVMPRPLCGIRALFTETTTPLIDYFWFFPGISGGYTYRDSSRSINRFNLSIGIVRASLVTVPIVYGRGLVFSLTYNPIGGTYDLNREKAEFSKTLEVEISSPVSDQVNAALTYTSTSPWRNRPNNHIIQTLGLGLKFKFK